MKEQPMEQTPEGTLKQHEIARLLDALLKSRGKLGATKEEMEKLVKWAEEARIDNALLELVLDGRVSIDWKNGGPIFRKDTL